MSERARALRPYLSDAVAAMLRRRRRMMRGNGAVLFVDIAGFTALTRAAAMQGVAGAEAVSARLNRFFSALIPVIGAHGGDVLDFGGDAIHALFPRLPGARRCAQALLDAARIDPELSIRIGVGAGAYRIDVIGDDAQRRALFSGSAVRRAAHAEKRAPHRAVRLHASGARAGPHPFGMRRQLHARASNIAGTSDALARPFLHPVLADRICAGQSVFVDEHRAVTVLFAGAADRATLAAVIAQAHALGGCVTRVDAAGDGAGLRALALFGAPVTHEDDARRAAHCARVLLASLGARARFGLASGTLFCGDAGAPERREYTVMGDAVNLAARLLQHAAPGSALADGPTVDGLNDAQPQPALSLTVKGFDAPVAAFSLARAHDATPAVQHARAAEHERELLGRENEQAWLDALMQSSCAGQGAALQIVGDPGMGKTSLAAWAMRRGEALGMRVLRAAAQPYGQPAYAVWAQLLRAWLGPLPDIGALERALRAELPDAVEALAWLARLLGLRSATHAWIDALAPATRTAELHAAVISAWLALARKRPLLLCIDDAHWLDAESVALLHALAARLGDNAVTLLALSRAPDRAMPLLQLGALAQPAAQRLAERALSGDASAVANIVERAQGNPYFVEQLAQFVRAGPERSAELPRSLRALLLQRIDQLGADEQTAIKLASVIGPQINRDWLRGCWPVAEPENFDSLLDGLVDGRLLRHEHEPGWVTHAFAHAALREAAYDALSAAARVALHERVGGWIESHHPPDDFLETLAHHFGRGADTGKQRRYFQLAGDAARTAYNNSAAIGHYERLLPLLAHERQPDVQVRLGAVCAHVGAWPQAEKHLRAAQAGADGVDGATAARAALELGKLLARSRSHAESAQWLTRAATHFSALKQPAQLCEALAHLAFAQMEQGELTAARATAHRHLRLAQRHALRAAEVDAQQMLGQLALQQGDLRRAHARLSLAARHTGRLRDKRRALLIGNDRATLAWQRGDYRDSFKHFRQALASARAIGWRAWTGVLLGNIGVLFWELGLLDRAATLLSEALAIARELDDKTSETICLGNLAAVRAEQGDLAVARAMFADAMALSARLRLPYYLCDQARQASELALRAGDLRAAARICARAADAAARAGDGDASLRARALTAHIAWARGKQSRTSALRAVRSLVRGATDAQRAYLHDVLWHIGGRAADAESALSLYTALYQVTPRQLYRARIAALGGRAPQPPMWARRLSVLALA